MTFNRKNACRVAHMLGHRSDKTEKNIQFLCEIQSQSETNSKSAFTVSKVCLMRHK